MAYLVAGPFVALVGIMAVFFVLRRKSVDKRSMYSARRSQIEHKVRAARQRTLTPHGRAERPPEQPTEAVSPFAPTQVQPTSTYQPSAFEAPPAAPPVAPPSRPQQAPQPPPWEQSPIPPPAPTPSFDYPVAQPEPFTPAPAEPFRPAPQPTPRPSPGEPSWTPAPKPAEPLPPAQPVAPVAQSASTTAAGGWSVVSSAKDDSASADGGSKKKKGKGDVATGSWQLASGDAPGMESDEPAAKRSSGTVMAVAQYAVLVVGLVMVLIGVLVMVANSHVT
ncbi:MAG: hypothetical protein E6I61_13710 [Chloroflexi bacterium]|nr:MAG: hypothetical protein E6I71_05935 [Chloroflexota bacterium]TME37945.1 MAG: hypothetical protein E6I61_13710 [Chloroflexota bacterium]TME52807.1 MAG: hypothetical protein E6I53_05085 [Chloroflexota bacterium]